MNKKNIQFIFKAVLLLGVLFGSNSAFAAQGIISPCQYLPLATDPVLTGVPNTTECIDVPVNLRRVHVVYTIDSLATSNGTATGAPIALRHIFMLGSVIKARIAAGLMDPDDVQIIGVIHGTSLPWALNDAWWEAKTDASGNQLYPNGNPYKGWIDKLFTLQNEGVNIQLEVCGVTLNGAGLTSNQVYGDSLGRIYVNQGAEGRIIWLQEHHYAIMQEGWVDSADK